MEKVTPPVTEGDAADADQALPAVDESAVPSWCGAIMEAGLWISILLASLFSSVLDRGHIYWICLPPIALCAIMWVLHWHYLRRSAFHVSWPLRVIIGALMIIYASAAALRAAWLSPLPDGSQWMGALLSLAVFVIVSGAFTETQLVRLLGFLAFAGVVQVILGLRLIGPDADKLPIFGPLAKTACAAGTIGNEWGLGIFLTCCILAAGTFAARSLATAVPAEGVIFHSRITWITSAGVNTALVALVAFCLMLMLLFLIESLLVFPICMTAIIVFVLMLALKGKTNPVPATGIVVVCLLLGVANLARPSDVKWGFSAAALRSNVRSLVSLQDTRARDPEEASAVGASSRPSDHHDDADLEPLSRKTPWPVASLLTVLVATLLASALWGTAKFHENQPILAAGAFSTIVAVVLFSSLGARIEDNLGVALAISVACAVAAVGGDFEEELEEEE